MFILSYTLKKSDSHLVSAKLLLENDRLEESVSLTYYSKDISMRIITPHDIQPSEKKELMEYFDARSFKMFVPIKDIYIDSSELFISIPTIHNGAIADVTSIYIGNKAWVESFKSFYDVIWKMNE